MDTAACGRNAPTILSFDFYLVALRPEVALESVSSTSHLLWKRNSQDGWSLGSNCQRLCIFGPFWRLLTSTSLVSDYFHPVSPSGLKKTYHLGKLELPAPGYHFCMVFRRLASAVSCCGHQTEGLSLGKLHGTLALAHRCTQARIQSP